MSTNPFDSFPLTTSSNTPGDRISNNPFVAEEPIKEEEDKKATIMSPRDLSILNDTKPREHPIQPPSDTVQFTVKSLEEGIAKTQQSLSEISARSLATFTKGMTSDVKLRVVSYEIVNNDYCLFHIEVSQYGVSQILKKRFKQLSEFHTSGGFGIDGPPKKAVKSSLKEQFLKERMGDIQKYFTRLELVKDIRKNPKFITFFELDALEEKKKDQYFIQTNQMKMMEEEIKILKEERDLWLNETFQLRTLKEVLTAKTHAAETEMMLAVTNLKAANELVEKLRKKLEIREMQNEVTSKLLKQLLSQNEDYDAKVQAL